MNYSELIKEFSAMCKAHGFSKSGKTFSRCIGDGIYQNISIAENSYLSPFCAEYSSTTPPESRVIRSLLAQPHKTSRLKSERE